MMMPNVLEASQTSFVYWCQWLLILDLFQVTECDSVEVPDHRAFGRSGQSEAG